MLVVQDLFSIYMLSLFSSAPYLLKIKNILAKNVAILWVLQAVPRGTVSFPEGMVEDKRRILPLPHTRMVSRGGESAETIMNGAHTECSLFVAQGAPCGCEMTKALRFRKQKSGRKLCKTGDSQPMTLPLNTVLLNGGEAWEQGNQEGVLVPLLLARPVAEIPAEAAAISPLQAAHGNHQAGPRKPAGIL